MCKKQRESPATISQIKLNILLCNVRGNNMISTRSMLKRSLCRWRVDICLFQQTKINKDVDKIAKQLWTSRLMRFGYIEADGSSGGLDYMGLKNLGGQ